ncbi:MAG: hypothetical protein Q9187_005563 [Circinaria calcarea]
MLIPAKLVASPLNYGKYDAFPYKDWAYPYEVRNAKEKKVGLGESPGERSVITTSKKMIERTTEPTTLCFLNEDGGSKRQEVSKWRKAQGYAPGTFPELLLSPEGKEIYVYIKRDELDERIFKTKRDFVILWKDNALSGQLIDHYEGSVILTRLEQATLALQCLTTREYGKYSEGDQSYALMGLLRQRPAVVKSDNAFQAFARLSLANDSDLLLERLICLLPRSQTEPWHSFSDEWGASLWDIYPKSQVCGIGDNNTVIIDGVRGAAIRWKSFAPVLMLVRETLLRRISRFTIRLIPLQFFAGIISLALYTRSKYLLAFGIVLTGSATVLVLALPDLLHAIYCGKTWEAQPWFFGVEGYMNLPELERHIFGFPGGRLKWSAAGSTLSRHRAEREKGFEHFCEGQDPSEDPKVKELIDRARKSNDGEKIFTLVDTYTIAKRY